MVQSTSSTFLGVRNPMAHYIPLWVLVIFVFLVVCICTMGGLQEGLGKRQFPGTKVNGDLEVTGDVQLLGKRTSVLTQRLTIPAASLANAAVNSSAFRQPANTTISGLRISFNGVVDTANAAATDTVEYRIGTTAAGVDICAATVFLARNTATATGDLLVPLAGGGVTGNLLVAGTETYNNATDVYGNTEFSATARNVFFGFLVGATGPLDNAADATVDISLEFSEELV